ncbi:NAD-dependent epimerase/dehydratase family protein [Uliginosibacterium paludis]|uniref:NAD(P)-dependent oxidoreductase n=1 Tax=Uliginosibacterium paludis TaxID=1615952 RepID=A0ABV2CRV6_9RHOO
MTKTVLVTGSRGLVGRRLCASLRNDGFSVKELDLLGHGEHYGDVTRLADVETGIQGCVGVVHLAAVSRVVWGQRDPELCWRTNVTGLQNLVHAALAQSSKPWILFSSSREVYGQAPSLPVAETTELNPLNVYARSKAEGERVVLDARSQGLQTAVVRLSNVYGCTKDHADRVIPAFARAAVEGSPLRVEGSNHTFDFTHVNDVVRGLRALIGLFESGEQSLHPVHLVSGHPTSLGELAAICCRLAKSDAVVTEAAPRSYDVARFYGDPGRAREFLGWEPEISLEAGLIRLIEDFRQEHALHGAMEASA